jgi:hypothetical protein
MRGFRGVGSGCEHMLDSSSKRCSSLPTPVLLREEEPLSRSLIFSPVLFFGQSNADKSMRKYIGIDWHWDLSTVTGIRSYVDAVSLTFQAKQ